MLVCYLLFAVGHGNTGVSTVALVGVPWFRGYCCTLRYRVLTDYPEQENIALPVEAE